MEMYRGKEKVIGVITNHDGKKDIIMNNVLTPIKHFIIGKFVYMCNLIKYLTFNPHKYFGRVIKLANGKFGVCNVVAIKFNNSSGLTQVILGSNLITDQGDLYYAARAVGGAAPWAVAGMRLGTGSTAPTKSSIDVTTFIATSGKAIDATYPKVSDGDTDNTGAGIDIATWRVTYATTEANSAGINEFAIIDNIVTPTKALSHALFAAPFTKTSSDTLKVIVNHQFNGV